MNHNHRQKNSRYTDVLNKISDGKCGYQTRNGRKKTGGGTTRVNDETAVKN